MISTITLPVPWDLKSVNVHVVELDDGYMLIDSGVATPILGSGGPTCAPCC